MQKKRISLTEKRNSIALCVFIFESLICQILSVFLVIPYISVVLMILLFVYIALTNKIYNSYNMKKILTLIGMILFLLGSSCFINGAENISQEVIYFLVFGITAGLIMIVNCNYKLVWKYSLRVSIGYLIYYFLFFRSSFKESNLYWSQQMGVAYGVLILVVISMVFLFYNDVYYFSKIEKILAFIVLVLGSYIIFFDCGTRGAMFAVIVALAAMSIAKVRLFYKILISVLGAIILAIFLLNLKEIVYYFYSILKENEITIAGVTKAINLFNTTADFSNGREELYKMAWEMFINSPIYGHGIGYYYKMTQLSYPHNIILQLLIEFGLIGTIVFLYLIIRDVVVIFFINRNRNQEMVLHVVLFLITIPLLFFSSSYWLLPSFWIYLCTIVKQRRFK